MATDDSRILASAPADSDDWDDETWAAWFRHAERVHGSPTGQARATDQIAELTASRETAIRWAVSLESECARLNAELAKYVGKEPTVAEEMQYLNRCLNAVHDLCEQAKKNAARWENPLPVPEWVEAVEKAASGERPDNPDDKRRRIYLDGKGNAWISVATDTDGTEYIAPIDSAWVDEGKPTGVVRAETGGLREIGRTW